MFKFVFDVGEKEDELLLCVTQKSGRGSADSPDKLHIGFCVMKVCCTMMKYNTIQYNFTAITPHIAGEKLLIETKTFMLQVYCANFE